MAVENGVEGAVSGVGGYFAGPGPHTTSGVLKAAAVGGATSAAPIPGAGRADLPTSAAPRLGDLSPKPEGVAYLRIDELGEMKPYVGQSKSLDRFNLRQTEHNRDFPETTFRFRELCRIEPGVELDRLEEYYIREMGGPTNKGNPDGLLSNKRHQMSDRRYAAAGGDQW